VPDPTVLVLGAGAAGLSAARVLLRAGVRVLVLEARGRTGGRVDTRADPLLGVAVERGAEFVHGRPAPVLALAREAGQRLERVPDGILTLRRGRLRPDGGAGLSGRAVLQRARDDRESVAGLLARAGKERWAGPEELRALRAFVEGFYLADPRTASAAALARMDRALATIDGDRSYRARGGWASLLAPLGQEAHRAGALHLGTRATAVRWRPGAVEVAARGPAGGPLPAFRGERLVVTLPLGVLRAGDVLFRPAPEAAAGAWARLEMGSALKVLLRFRRPLWEAATAGTTSFLRLPGAPVPIFWTLAPARAPLLVGWVGGPRARRLAALGEQAALRAALRGLAPALRRSPRELEQALDGAEVVDWARDPLARGGYAVFPVGAAGAQEALARPVAGTLFFAGEATEPDLAGTVDGALRSGARAAREVLASLRG